MKPAIDKQSRIVVALAFCMTLSSAVLFYYDHRLNQAGIGSPLGFGDTITGTVSMWLQPWIILLSLAGFPFWSIHFVTHLVVGLFSGGILAWITFYLKKRWKSLFWLIAVVLVILTVSCSFYSLKGHKMIESLPVYDAP